MQAQLYSTEVVNATSGFDLLWNDMPHAGLEVEAVVEGMQYLLFYYQVKVFERKGCFIASIVYLPQAIAFNFDQVNTSLLMERILYTKHSLGGCKRRRSSANTGTRDYSSASSQ